MSWSLAARHRWRAASRIHGQLIKALRDRDQIELPLDSWELLKLQVKVYTHAVQAAWSHAQIDLKFDLHRRLTDLGTRLQQIGNSLKRQASTPMPVSFIWADLETLPDEFEDVEVDLATSVIRVTTDDIEMEGYDLGRFQVNLQWNLLGQNHCYRIKALDPHPAESEVEMVHPHVNNEYLCEGDGASSIRQALLQGRLLDFFILVRQILTTYNPSSAYLALERWHGVNCQSCSSLMNNDDSLSCPCCGDLICQECASSCSNCTDSMCGTCVKACPHCENYFCTRCMIHCSTCMADGCDACLVDGLCPSCQTPEESDDDESLSADEEDDEADAEDDPYGVGQVALHA